MTDLRGKFIVFDGGEGCGKSTQISLLSTAAREAGVETVAVRDPGHTRIGEMIRAILLNPDHIEMNMRCEMLLYMSARAQMLAEVIRPALDAGKLVLSDRFVSSTLAYQIGGDGLTAQDIRAVAEIAIGGRWPDLTIILDMPAHRSIERVRAKFEHKQTTLFGVETKVVKDRIEMRPMEYHERVRQAFLQQATDDPTRYRVIDADRTIETVHADVLAAVQSV
ncbi:MAG TPA: dTMP kinase [Tepidisphaeraceae bacterium]|nr:dTMP kinase [Tepidisphaeraceae bacterium]